MRILLLSLYVSLAGCTSMKVPSPPVARMIPEVTELHGERRVDEYAWMKTKGAKELEGHLRAETAYTSRWMERTATLRDRVYREILGRVQETDTSPPYPWRGYEYYSRTEKGQQYAIQCRRKLPSGAEEVLLDLNELGRNEKYIGLGLMSESDDHRLLAHSLDRTGFRQYTMRVKDLSTGELLPEIFERVRGAAWAADSRTLFYTTENDAKRSSKVYRHVLGNPVAQDALVYEEKDERFGVRVARSRSLAYVILSLSSRTASEHRFVDATKPTDEFRTILPRVPDVEYDVDHRGDSFYIITNDKGRTKRMIQVTAANPLQGPVVELLPVRPDVMLEGVDVFEDFYVLTERANGIPRLRSIDFRTKREATFAMPEQDYYLGGAMNAEHAATEFRYVYTSMVTPPTVMARNIATAATRVVKVEPVPTYDATKYETRRLFATARDGTKVPVSLAMRKGTKPNGRAPLYLHGYGSYGLPMESVFDASEVSLMDRGVIVAMAHPRGGGEYGKPWHDAGRMLNKRNTFTDFIDIAEHLVREGWTKVDRLAINGGSAGGLLMGAVLNLRPGLFKAALVEVPFVDVINTMLDESLPLTVEEFEEWGNPKLKAEYEYMMSYSPYDNIAAQAYPAILVRSSYNDSQVLYHEPAKWVAKLRSLKTDHNPLLLRMEMDPAGHGGRSGRYEQMKDTAYDLSFILWQLGRRE